MYDAIYEMYEADPLGDWEHGLCALDRTTIYIYTMPRLKWGYIWENPFGVESDPARKK